MVCCLQLKKELRSLGGVNCVAHFIAIDDSFNKTEAAISHMQTMLP